MTPEQELSKLVEQERARQREAIQRAMEQGGLPSATEAAAAYEAITAAFDEVERLVWRVKGITESDDGAELPFAVDFGQIGIVAVLAEDIGSYAGYLGEFAEQLQSSIGQLRTLMAERTVSTEAGD